MRAIAVIAICLPPAASAADTAASLERASAHLRRHEIGPAIRELTRAIAREPRSAAAHLLLGQAYLAKGAASWIAEAKAEFQQALALDPSQVLANFHIAKIDLDLGRIQQAERQLRQALDRQPEASFLLALLAEVRRRQGRLEEAIALATRAFEADPTAGPALYFRALARIDRDEDSLALADLERAASSPYVMPEMHQAMGSIHLRRDRVGEAEAAFGKAIALSPDRAEAHLGLARALRRQRRFTEALAELRRVESAPQLSSEYFQKLSADAAFEKGLVLKDQGDESAARRSFERALEFDPAHEGALGALRAR